jgi:hypothetical protein
VHETHAVSPAAGVQVAPELEELELEELEPEELEVVAVHALAHGPVPVVHVPSVCVVGSGTPQVLSQTVGLPGFCW